MKRRYDHSEIYSEWASQSDLTLLFHVQNIKGCVCVSLKDPSEVRVVCQDHWRTVKED